MRSIASKSAATLFCVGLIAASTAAAQTATEKTKEKPPAGMAGMDHSKMGQMDHSKMGQMDHSKMGAMEAKSGWKELDAYHQLVMDTWHPAKDKNDLAPTRAKSADLVKAAKALASSTAPKGCDTPKLKEAAAEVPRATQAVADLAAKNADDAALKAALKDLHDKFEVLAMGCSSATQSAK